VDARPATGIVGRYPAGDLTSMRGQGLGNRGPLAMARARRRNAALCSICNPVSTLAGAPTAVIPYPDTVGWWSPNALIRGTPRIRDPRLRLASLGKAPQCMPSRITDIRHLCLRLIMCSAPEYSRRKRLWNLRRVLVTKRDNAYSPHNLSSAGGITQENRQ
jgi:hypothetical protein